MRGSYCSSWRLLLFVVIVLPLPVLSGSMVQVGDFPAAIRTPYSTIHTLKAFQGRIYMGYGDWNNHPAVVINSYRPATEKFHWEFSANTDSIGVLREIAGRLWVPHTDPVHYDDFKDLSYLSDGVWRDMAPFGMLHVFDIATLTGSDLWCVGSRTVTDTNVGGAAVFRSVDGGRTWTDVTVPSTQDRYYYGFALRGRFYVVDARYDESGAGQRFSTLWPSQIFKATTIGTGSNESMVAIDDLTPGIGLPQARNLVAFNGLSWSALRSGVFDFAWDGSNLYTLEQGSLWRRNYPAPVETPWERLDFDNVSASAKAVEVMDGVIYVADTLGFLWAGRLDGEPMSPPPLLSSDLADEFGRGLAVDGNTVAVGAPGQAVRNALTGQVTVWERTSDETGEFHWNRTGVIDPPDPSFCGWFGKDLALNGDALVIAETGRDLTLKDRGYSSQAHLYQRTQAGWVRRQSLTLPYIHSVAMDGDLLAVTGADVIVIDPTYRVTLSKALFYALARDSNGVVSATAIKSIRPTHASEIYEPTMRAVMDSDLVAVSVSGDVSRWGGPGEVSVYQRIETGALVLTNALRREELTESGTVSLKPDRFGFALSLKNDWLAVGAPRDDTMASQSGAVHLYQWTLLTNGSMSFELKETIYSPIAQAEAAFGSSVALTDTRLIVGSPGVEVDGTRHHGRLFIYQYSGSNWVQTGEVRPPSHSTGEFGTRVAVSSDWLAVGSRFSNVSTNLLDRVAVMPHLDPFPAWLAFHGLDRTNALASSDSDGDGANNLVEFACNLDPQHPDALPLDPIAGRSGLPSVQQIRSGGETLILITELRRRSSSLAGLTYAGELSTDLQTWLPSATEPHSVEFIDGQWEKATFRFPIPSDTSQLFYRSKVHLGAAE